VRLGRREFLRTGARLGIGLGALPLLGGRARAADPPSVRRYAALGRTGLKVSDVSFGSSRTDDPDVVRYALDRGVTYFDTAEGYRRGRSESAIGEALAGERDRVAIASKTKCGAGTRRAELMRALEGSLRRLRTDRIDVYFNHAVNDPARLKNPEWFEFVAAAKRQGKIRFSGMSGHGGRLIECLDYALDEDLIDVMLVAYNFGQDPAFYEKFTRSLDFVAVQPDLPRVLRKAKSKGVGVVAMKTLMGGRLNDLRPYEASGATFAQAAFRWVLSSPDVDALVISMKSRQLVDEYLGASGWRAAHAEDAALLRRYAERQSNAYCRPGCGACLDACPHRVDVPEVLRTRMYAVDYGDAEHAREEYAALGAGAAACLGCAQRACAGACPHGLPLDALVPETHDRLGRRARPA
jgi:predicted aldo/keto reductase-like oxidoreductase